MQLELLAPARNSDIGIAAVDCGADAVYIAGPAFGARAAAGNDVSDIERLCAYAHRLGVRIYATVNTIIYEDEVASAEKLLRDLYEAGVDAFIIQDAGILRMNRPPVPLHASTQMAIRTAEDAARLCRFGFERLILERQLSLEEIRAIRQATDCELEFFVHGALCVSYSGNCYLSQYLAGRSANRGACIQACRGRYDLVDADGKVLLRDRSLLSMKDLRLDGRISDLVDAGISSFKIEGRLKNAAYVKNVVRHYRNVIDSYLKDHPEHSRASFGTVEGGFTPDIEAVFNRGYTQAWIDGCRKDGWMSADAAKSLGEFLGKIASIQGNSITVDTEKAVSNGDGLAFVGPDGQIDGQRADLVEGRRIRIKDASGLRPGQKVYRNYSQRLEREIESNMPRRLLMAEVSYSTHGGRTVFEARCENGCTAVIEEQEVHPVADKPQRATDTLRSQIEKVSSCVRFRLVDTHADQVYFYPASYLNDIRRRLAAALEEQTEKSYKRHEPRPEAADIPAFAPRLTYLANCANPLAESLYRENGAAQVAPAYELRPVEDADLMRMRYCIRYEAGLCPKQHPAAKVHLPLYLVNRGYRLRLDFDCARCEMTVRRG
ncbi:MAG: U32 family peptidase [Bacteroidales bacterium]|nr:U32 family peptidase [Bacteroidales bacterium]